jgi:hypothetical protein
MSSIFNAEKLVKRLEFPYPKTRQHDDRDDDKLHNYLEDPDLMERRVNIAQDDQSQYNVHPSDHHSDFLCSQCQ